MKDRAYTKLSGRSALNVQQAFLGTDHLLVVEGVYQERSKRIDYADIQAILICPTKSGSIVSLLAGLGGLLFTGIALSQFGSDIFYFWLVVALVIWTIFGVGLYQRGSVVFGLQTAVQTVILSGLGTQRKAARAKPLLAARIEQAQGRLDEAALRAARANRLAARSLGPRPLPAAGARVPAGPPPMRTESGTGSPTASGEGGG